MPNWCGNTLIVSGNKESIKRFRDNSKGDDTEISFENLLPTPKEMLDGDAWYAWRLNNWGTKWDVNADVIEESDDRITYCFESAWSPPVDWLREASKQFPDLFFKLIYREDGCAFMGTVEIEDSAEVENYIDTSNVWKELENDGFNMDSDEGQDEYYNRLDAMENNL